MVRKATVEPGGAGNSLGPQVLGRLGKEHPKLKSSLGNKLTNY